MLLKLKKGMNIVISILFGVALATAIYFIFKNWDIQAKRSLAIAFTFLIVVNSSPLASLIFGKMFECHKLGKGNNPISLFKFFFSKPPENGSSEELALKCYVFAQFLVIVNLFIYTTMVTVISLR